jgi:hypothetical protein
MPNAVLKQTFARPHASALLRWLHRLNRRMLRGHVSTLVIGDSHVAFAGKHPDVLRLLGDMAFAGVPGDDCANVRWRLLHGEFDWVVCDTLVVVLGSNMLAEWLPSRAAAEAIVELARVLQLKVCAKHLYVHGVLHDHRLNYALKQAAGVHYIPPPTGLVFGRDGVHLAWRGYVTWARSLAYWCNIEPGTAKALPAWLWRIIDTGIALKAKVRT